ncbi:hypothetical protein B0H16DRAFT_1743940 [Mycena metata]|uniref:Uncharacterized protein n=1 Tax=Mycena metata TaxID=1033252 RepID=A0AAD7ME25_9AGAR|nr:hypothetical protein B0H16DRAFT_1743940 [Mycena metata]
MFLTSAGTPASVRPLSSRASSSRAPASVATGNTLLATAATTAATTQATMLAWPSTSFAPKSGCHVCRGFALNLEAHSIDNLAELYVEKVREAAAIGDFSLLLSSQRRFCVLNDNGTIASFGNGIETECIQRALNTFLDKPGRWGLPTDEDRLSLAPSMPLRMASSVSPARLEEVRTLGALISLGLISGKPPGAVSPGLLQYARNEQKLEALTPSFVSSWHPTFDHVARQIQAAGHLGDLLQFQSTIINTLGIQVQQSPLYLTVMPTSIMPWSTKWFKPLSLVPNCMHPEMAAFTDGLELPCANGFSFGNFARSYPGGTEFYLAQAWTSCIASYESIQPHLIVTSPPSSRLLPHFGSTAHGLDPEGLFAGFLRRCGNPFPADVFEDVKVHFHADVVGQLHTIDSPAFRPRMLAWATTGSPFLHPDVAQTDTIQVLFVLPDDQYYGDNPANSAAHMRHGTISFRSCSRVARIPMAKLVELHQTTVDADAFQKAVDVWLLLQILNGVGKVSML